MVCHSWLYNSRSGPKSLMLSELDKSPMEKNGWVVFVYADAPVLVVGGRLNASQNTAFFEPERMTMLSIYIMPPSAGKKKSMVDHFSLPISANTFSGCTTTNSSLLNAFPKDSESNFTRFGFHCEFIRSVACLSWSSSVEFPL